MGHVIWFYNQGNNAKGGYCGFPPPPPTMLHCYSMSRMILWSPATFITNPHNEILSRCKFAIAGWKISYKVNISSSNPNTWSTLEENSRTKGMPFALFLQSASTFPQGFKSLKNGCFMLHAFYWNLSMSWNVCAGFSREAGCRFRYQEINTGVGTQRHTRWKTLL